MPEQASEGWEMGAAIRDAEDRASLREAIENGWPVTVRRDSGAESCQ